MRTFNDVVSELRGKMRNATYITILKTAGMNAVILDSGECVAKFVDGVITQVTPVPVDAPGVEPVPEQTKAEELVVVEAVEQIKVEEPLQRTKVRKSRWNESPDEPVTDHDQE